MSKKTCLLTGYPGFWGSHLYGQLAEEYEVYTLGLTEAPTPRHIVADLSRGVPALEDVPYDLVVHVAGKAHSMPRTPAEEEEFFRVNEQGTHNLLAALQGPTQLPKAVVLVSTVAVYGRETGNAIDEECPLHASDAYGLSKLRAEAALSSWKSAGVVKAVIRMPLIVGKNPPGNLGKMIAGIKKGAYFDIGGGKARRSFVWIEDIVPFIARLVASPSGGIYNLTDGTSISYGELNEAICKALHMKKRPSLPYGLALLLALIGDVLERILHRKVPFDSYALRKMTSDLTFSCDKAVREFQWTPTRVLDRIGDAI